MCWMMRTTTLSGTYDEVDDCIALRSDVVLLGCIPERIHANEGRIGDWYIRQSVSPRDVRARLLSTRVRRHRPRDAQLRPGIDCPAPHGYRARLHFQRVQHDRRFHESELDHRVARDSEVEIQRLVADHLDVKMHGSDNDVGEAERALTRRQHLSAGIELHDRAFDRAIAATDHT